MKVSILALLAAGMLATASVIPCEHQSTNDVTDEVTVFTTKETCLRVCFPKRHRCAKGWRPRKKGRCWTCCKRVHHPHEEAEAEEDVYDFEDLLD
jgi:hypothetical protein